MIDRVPEEYIDELLENATYTSSRIKNAVILTCTLENGFTLTGASGTIQGENFDFYKGREIALSKIKRQLWDMEGYRACCENWKEKNGQLKRFISE